jgi:hypothetical protein
MVRLSVALLFSYSDIPLVRHQATGFVNMTSTIATSIEGRIEGDQPSDGPLQIDTLVDERVPAKGELSPVSQSPSPRSRRSRPRERMLFTSQPRYASPEARFCDGWCQPSDDEHATVVGIVASLCRNTLISFLLAALSICLLGLAARMGRPERLSDYGLVQLS